MMMLHSSFTCMWTMTHHAWTKKKISSLWMPLESQLAVAIIYVGILSLDMAELLRALL